MGRPTRGSRSHEFYAELDSTYSKAIDGQLPSSLDSAFQLQEYISALVRADPHNIERIVKLPSKDEKGGEKDDAEVDEACWIYEHLRRLALDLTYPLVDMLQNNCNRRTCPEMKAGDWLYLCVAHGSSGAMEQCCAIDYIVHTIDSATALLNSPRAFPSRISVPVTSRRHFTSLARRLGRIFAHAYFHHQEGFAAAEAQNSLYARFLALCKQFDLVPPEFLVIPSPQDVEGATSDGLENGLGRQNPQSASISPDAPSITILSRPGDDAKAGATTDGQPSTHTTSQSRSPRNRLRTDTMYLSGTFHEANPNFSSTSGGNVGDMDARRVPSPLAATLASQEEEDENAALSQAKSMAEGSNANADEAVKDTDETHFDLATLVTPTSVPNIISNAAKILIRDFALEGSLTSSVSISEPTQTTIASKPDSDAVTTTTIPVPAISMTVPPIVVNAPEVVISPAGDDDVTPSFPDTQNHTHVITEVSAEDEDEENPDVDDLEHALENDEEEEEEVENDINVDMEWPESDIASSSAIELRFEEIAHEPVPEPEKQEQQEQKQEDEEQPKLEHASTLDSSLTTSALENASIELEQPPQSITDASQDTAITAYDKASDPIADNDADDTGIRDNEHDSSAETVEASLIAEPSADTKAESNVAESEHLDTDSGSNASSISSEPVQSQPTSTDGPAVINESLPVPPSSPDDATSALNPQNNKEEKTEQESKEISSTEPSLSEATG